MDVHDCSPDIVTLFLCGDVMTGRGVDQVLPHPSEPTLDEPWVRDAREYVALAESASGPIPRAVDPSYVWGDAIAELDGARPDVRIINLETSVTMSNDRWSGKGIHYRMHPENVGCLTAARVDVAVLANNHVLDYGRSGLVETLDTLERAGIATAGAGRDLRSAQAPAVVPLAGSSRLLVVASACESSGVYRSWAAQTRRAGLDLLPDLSETTAAGIATRVASLRTPDDLVIASIHWGGNWGYDLPLEHTRFARRLIDGGIDLVYGHSSHHPQPIELYRHRLILYGCGDFIDDYEGIAGHEAFRGDLVLMYFASLDARNGGLAALRMTPMQIRKMRLNRATARDGAWLCETLNRVSTSSGSRIERAADGTLLLCEAS
jgi:poly-gamma-glutamate synthesis protein (capsule biosynthesis protein)